MQTIKMDQVRLVKGRGFLRNRHHRHVFARRQDPRAFLRVKPDLNDLGIVGCILPGGKRGYRILLGGHWGRTGERYFKTIARLGRTRI